MSTFVIPPLDEEPWPTLGPQVRQLIVDCAIHGPGDLRGQKPVIDAEKAALIDRIYQVYPRDHPRAGRRRFKRVAISLRKGSAKTELAAWVMFGELHPEGPVRTDGWRKQGKLYVPVGRPVTDPYIPMIAYTERQTEELAYGALLCMCSEGPDADLFDSGKDRITRAYGDGKAEALATAPDSADGARTTCQHFDEPLALDTPVPTPSGWTTLGALAVGDLVFGLNGRPARVLGMSPTRLGRQCYRVTFANGTSVVTDADHRWSVVDRRAARKGRQAATTEQMSAEIRVAGWAGRPTYRWAVPLAAPLESPDVELPVEPYALGVWLGDGDARNATVSQSTEDVDELAALLSARGFQPSRCTTPKGRCALLYVRGLRAPLRKTGLLGNKHIPVVYFRASFVQRLDLLRGLMDTDGHVTPAGWCAFVTGAQALALQVAELARTLGYRPTVKSATDPRSREGVTWKVSFQASPDHAPFLLARKVARCVGTKRATRQGFNSVVSIEVVGSVPVRCIGVDSEDHLFLVGEGLIPTHNTHRMTLPRQKEARQTMKMNIPKRVIADAWEFETTTTYAEGEGSVAQDTHDYAEMIAKGKTKDATLFFFHREAPVRDDEDLEDPAQIREAIRIASGPALAKWVDFEGQVDSIANLYMQPDTDRAYWERVWLNRRVSASRQAFDPIRWSKLLAKRDVRIPEREPITVGFDGARWRDAAGFIATHIETGFQWPLAFWEKPENMPKSPEGGERLWEVTDEQVDGALGDAMDRYQVVLVYADPPRFEANVAKWSGKYGEKRVAEWYTNRGRQIGQAMRAYRTAQTSGALSHSGDATLGRHIANARRADLNQLDDDDTPLWTIYKPRPDSPLYIDLAMAGCLSWQARLDALTKGGWQKKARRKLIVMS